MKPTLPPLLDSNGHVENFPWFCPRCGATSWCRPGELAARGMFFDNVSGGYKAICCDGPLSAKDVENNRGAQWWKALVAQSKKAARKELHADQDSATRAVPS